jgi:23S rRNA (uracil1939-C5)-methyltransferase
MHINEVPGNAIFNADEYGIRTTPLVGKRTIEDEIAGVRMQIGAADFFQANPGTAELIVKDVLELTADMRERPVVDLFCGVGTFTLPLATVHPWVGGIEVVHGAVERGRESARSLRLPVEFTVGPVAEKLPELASRLKASAPVVVLDPSRRGLSPEAYDPIEALNPARLLYVSCNPAALARDLRIWIDKGWAVDEIRAYDMFPQTAHLEMLAVLSPPSVPVPTTGGPRRRIVR